MIYMIDFYTNNDLSNINVKEKGDDYGFEYIDDEDENIIGNIVNIKKVGEKVFFVETKNTTEHKLTTRQACSIESAGMYVKSFYLNSNIEFKKTKLK